jgi:hypothetical protein
MKPYKTSTKTYNMLKLPFGKETISKTGTFKWFPKFKSGMTFIQSTQCLGHYFPLLVEFSINSSKERHCEPPFLQTFRGTYQKMSCRNILRNDTVEIGFSITTIFLLTLLCLCRNFRSETAWLLSPTLRTYQI